MAGPALLVLDMINELVHPDGKYSHVCLQQVTSRQVIDRTAEAIRRSRAAAIPVIYVVLAFSEHYQDWPRDSMLFGPPDPQRRFRAGTWGAAIHERLTPLYGDDIVFKRRISPFLGTSLEMLLRARDIDTVLCAGVATDLVVLSTAREAHDRGFGVTVLEDATATVDEYLQCAAITLIARTAQVAAVDDVLPAGSDSRQAQPILAGERT